MAKHTDPKSTNECSLQDCCRVQLAAFHGSCQLCSTVDTQLLCQDKERTAIIGWWTKEAIQNVLPKLVDQSKSCWQLHPSLPVTCLSKVQPPKFLEHIVPVGIGRDVRLRNVRHDALLRIWDQPGKQKTNLLFEACLVSGSPVRKFEPTKSWTYSSRQVVKMKHVHSHVAYSLDQPAMFKNKSNPSTLEQKLRWKQFMGPSSISQALL